MRLSPIALCAVFVAIGCSSPSTQPTQTRSADDELDPLAELDEAGELTAAPVPVPAAVPAATTPKSNATTKAKPFVSDAERIAALGSVIGLDAATRAALSPLDFEPLPAPSPGDWLAEHSESGQSYRRFVASSHVEPDASRDTLYIQPLGRLEASGAPAAAELKKFAETYFDIPVKVLRPVAPKTLKLRWRPRRTGDQLHAGSVLKHLKTTLPKDAFVVIAVTGYDLYPDDDWNFVFGMATFRERVGVYSTARYNPTFYNAKVAIPGFEQIVLRRTLNIMAHEIGHMYGLEHCVHYRCAMNGSNSLRETDESPIHLCPVCLRKLRHGAKFDIDDRYSALAKYYKSRKLVPEWQWLSDRISRLADEKH